MITIMCPHCGCTFPRSAAVDGLIPEHAANEDRFLLYGKWQYTKACPGSLQGARNPDSDRRPLWQDGGVP